MLRRGLKGRGWSWDRATRQTVACFASEIEEFEVRAAIVLHLDPKHVPRAWVEESRAMNEALPAYFTVCYGYDDADIPRLVLDGDRQVLVNERRGASSLEDAEDCALDWVGEGRVYPFRELPGIYQAAYHDWLTGRRWDTDMTTNMWMVSVSDVPNYCAAREFPPPRERTKLTPDPSMVSMVALPRYAVEEMYRGRGW